MLSYDIYFNLRLLRVIAEEPERCEYSTGIERMLNLVNIAHSAMKILPHHNACWKEFHDQSTQELRFFISEQISRQVFFDTLRAKVETMRKSTGFFNTLAQQTEDFRHVA